MYYDALAVLRRAHVGGRETRLLVTTSAGALAALRGARVSPKSRLSSLHTLILQGPDSW